MKNIFLLSLATCLTLSSCTKKDLPATVPASFSLDGKWRMILVTDNVSGMTATKPGSIQKDVDITIVSTNASTGTFTGNTPTNEISQNAYANGADQSLSIPNLGMTKVMETSWGSEFVDHIRSSQAYGFDTDGRLIIRTIHKSLSFRKL